MPTAVTGAAAVFGPMPGIASGLLQASSPASASPMSPPSSESAAICHGDDGSAARSSSGSVSSGTARNLFFALVLDATARSRCTSVKPKAAFYILPKLDVKKFNITDDEQFALDLLHEKHILITRGGGFNWEKPDHFRIVYLPRMGVLHEAMEDLADFLAHYRQRWRGIGNRVTTWAGGCASGRPPC